MAETSGRIFTTDGVQYPGSVPADHLNVQTYTVPANKLTFLTSISLYIYYAGASDLRQKLHSITVGDMLIHERWRSHGDATLQDPVEAAFRNRLYWLHYAGGNYINTNVHTTTPASRDEFWNFIFIKPIRISAGNTVIVKVRNNGGNNPINFFYNGTEVDV